MSLVYALLVGVAMGALIQRVGASSPRMILASLRLENTAIMKFMAVTIAVGTVAVYVLSYFIPMHFDIKPTYVVGVVVGGLIFGTGFAVGGYCPGTCVVGVGEGRRDAIGAVLGGVAGALVFTLIYTLIETPLIKPMNYGKVTLYGLLHLPPVIVAIAVSAVLFAGSALLPTVTRRSIGGRDFSPTR